MLIFEHYVAPSQIEGLGLFTNEHLTKNRILWTFNPIFDITFTPEQVSSLPYIVKQYIKKYGWLDIDDNTWHISIDGDKYTNHSDTPNTYMDTNGNICAKIDIPKGSEITSNYGEFDVDFKYKLQNSN